VSGSSDTPERLSHLDERGDARMVDVSGKGSSARLARAEGVVRMRPETLTAITAGQIPKGDVFATARIAGILAAKKVPDLVPLCHPIHLDGLELKIDAAPPDRVRITATAKAKDVTGVEMEALTAVSVAALTLYDMCKAVDRGMIIESVKLTEKSGGKSGDWKLEE
jgi:molybdenum cofactor biosynthesis protein MoaC